MVKQNIVVATIRPWNIERFARWVPPEGYEAQLISDKGSLTLSALTQLAPRYVFFPHWSWIIPTEILNNFECVLFHMTNLPFGRGGSPMQNLIEQGIYQTKISAIRVADGLDEGPVYLKRSLDLSTGSAQQLFEKMADEIFVMMTEITTTQPQPVEQSGEPTFFKRRTPEQSQITPGLSGRKLYDFIRMLDAEGYPRAFAHVGDVRVEFSGAELLDNEQVAARAIFKSIDPIV